MEFFVSEYRIITIAERYGNWGVIYFNGIATFGRGSRICVGTDAVLSLGHKFRITGDTTIICCKNISFGNGCLISWDVQIMDSDFHSIISLSNGYRINCDAAISVTNHAWIGSKSTILKGVFIEDDVVIAAGSVVAGKRLNLILSTEVLVKILKN